MRIGYQEVVHVSNDTNLGYLQVVHVVADVYMPRVSESRVYFF